MLACRAGEGECAGEEVETGKKTHAPQGGSDSPKKKKTTSEQTGRCPPPCIQSLMAQVHNWQSKNQELQVSHHELAQSMAVAASISQSYGDRMTQILSTQTKQELLVPDYQQESKDMASTVAGHLQMSNHYTAKSFSVVEALAKNYATIASRSMSGINGTPIVRSLSWFFQPPPRGPLPLLNLRRLHLLSLPHKERILVFPVAGVPFLFHTTHLPIASIIQPLMRTLGGLRGGRRNTNTPLMKSLQLRRGGRPPRKEKMLGLNPPNEGQLLCMKRTLRPAKPLGHVKRRTLLRERTSIPSRKQSSPPQGSPRVRLLTLMTCARFLR